MKKLLFAAMVAATTGCDNPVVAEHIIDNFVCTYMPWWMGDCQSAEVVDKVMSTLDNGIVEASVKCAGTALHHGRYNVPGGDIIPGMSTYVPFVYKAQRLQEGTCFVSWSTPGEQPFANAAGDIGFIPRSSADAAGCSVLIDDEVRLSITEGQLVAHSTALSVYPLFQFGSVNLYPTDTPDTVIDLDTCTGFNLEAFE